MDLLGSHASKLGHFFFALMFVAIVAAAPDDANEVGWQAGEWLLVKYSPVLILVSEVAGREIVLNYD